MPVGQTQDAGWQIGVSRTLDHPLERVWDALVTSPDLCHARFDRWPDQGALPRGADI